MPTVTEERIIFGVVATLLLFLMINFDQQLGIIFLGFALVDIILVFSDKYVSLKTETTTSNRFEAVLYSFIAYGVFLGLSVLTLKFVYALKAVGIIKELSTQVPVLSDVVWLAIVAYGVLIPIIETRFFFGRLLEFLADWRHINISKSGLTSFKTWALIAFISVSFTLFHLSAKISSGNIGLLTTFIFGMISGLMVIYFQEIKQAIGLHVITNTHASICKYAITDLFCGAS